MTEQQMRAWITRLIMIASGFNSIQDNEIKMQRVHQIVGYIESLENIEI